MGMEIQSYFKNFRKNPSKSNERKFTRLENLRSVRVRNNRERRGGGRQPFRMPKWCSTEQQQKMTIQLLTSSPGTQKH